MADPKEAEQLLQQMLSRTYEADRRQKKFDQSVNTTSSQPPADSQGYDITPYIAQVRSQAMSKLSPDFVEKLWRSDLAGKARTLGAPGIGDTFYANQRINGDLGAGLFKNFQANQAASAANRAAAMQGQPARAGTFDDQTQDAWARKRAQDQQDVADMMSRLGVQGAQQTIDLNERNQSLAEKTHADTYDLENRAENRRKGIIEGVFPYIALLMQKLR